jgi:hypothetical protein
MRRRRRKCLGRNGSVFDVLGFVSFFPIFRFNHEFTRIGTLNDAERCRMPSGDTADCQSALRWHGALAFLFGFIRFYSVLAWHIYSVRASLTHRGCKGWKLGIMGSIGPAVAGEKVGECAGATRKHATCGSCVGAGGARLVCAP